MTSVKAYGSQYPILIPIRTKIGGVFPLGGKCRKVLSHHPRPMVSSCLFWDAHVDQFQRQAIPKLPHSSSHLLLCCLATEFAKHRRNFQITRFKHGSCDIITLGTRIYTQLERMFRRQKHPVSPSWLMDETYVKTKGIWYYLYRVVDKEGNTIDFYLS